MGKSSQEIVVADETKPTCTRAEVLKTIFLEYALKFDDQAAAALVPPLLMEAIREKHGVNHIGSDLAAVLEAQRAEEILGLLPQNESRSGLPRTRELLWQSVGYGLIHGSPHTPHFAKVLLRKERLSADEQKRLRDALKNVFDDVSGLEVRKSLFLALREVSHESEEITVRALLHAIARHAEPADLVQFLGK
jgi:hypothetical protein